MHQPEKGLKRGLNARHIRCMALGSAIGTGLFYGSASAIQMAGPAVLLAYLIGGLNLCNVKVYGEMEFWLSLLKVVAIVAMILAGFGIMLFGLGSANGDTVSGIANLTAHGGFMPNGVSGLIASFAVVMFAFGGIEIIGITAGEAKDPQRVLPKAINAVPLRILLFYVLTLFVLMCLYPWPQIGTQGSPFVQIFSNLGIGSAAAVLNIVVISAAVSAINSDIFAAGRMMYGLAQQGQAPKGFAKVSRQGVPWMTVLVMGVALLSGVVLNYLIPENVFLLIASIATFATVWVWLMILVTQVAMRRSMSREEAAQLKFPVPFWPYGPAAAIAFMVFIFGVLGYFPDTQAALLVGVVWVVFLVASYLLWCKPRVAVAPAQVLSNTQR